jgi:transcriptional regulator with XRE-family HTH domain
MTEELYNGEKIRRAMVVQEITEKELAKRTNISEKTLNNLKKARNTNVLTLKKVARELGIPMQDLFEGAA